ncbi:hypothetical protein POVWA2_083030 [Plasmodium ovale wallikeri]|uniref:PIR Superfamily Protein n=1 Tax=Plasmodium ovale wallikeri TaxID=864142 RepID=A0A1A9AN31_PLAOA|nr:hypothetical protein POVWA2_083030 [Plasmodium ovale wallikeri]SBT58340.1 hypothetical protein POVWA1_087140 [Plasmodium ovale wallikeri]
MDPESEDVIKLYIYTKIHTIFEHFHEYNKLESTITTDQVGIANEGFCYELESKFGINNNNKILNFL